MRPVLSLVLLTLAAALAQDASARPHESSRVASCMDCHGRIPFKQKDSSCQDNISEVCRRCHYSSHAGGEGFSHPLNISPSMPVPGDMPLDKKGMMTCATCHTFHRSDTTGSDKRPSFLRRAEGRKICQSCHRKII